MEAKVLLSITIVLFCDFSIIIPRLKLEKSFPLLIARFKPGDEVAFIPFIIFAKVLSSTSTGTIALFLIEIASFVMPEKTLSLIVVGNFPSV